MTVSFPCFVAVLALGLSTFLSAPLSAQETLDPGPVSGVDTEAPLLTGEGEDDFEVDVPEGSVLNLHETPQSLAPVTGALVRGDDVRSLGCRHENGRRWCRVETPQGEGWVVARFLRQGEGTRRTISVSTRAPQRSVEVESDWVVTGIGVNGLIDLRAGPSRRDRIIGGLPYGRHLRARDCRRKGGRDWCQVAGLAGVSVGGWVERRYLEPMPRTGAVERFGDEAPAVILQQTGDIEVAYDSGCSLFFGMDGGLIAASSRCTPVETLAADDAARQFRMQMGN